jgi:hypothetical protein
MDGAWTLLEPIPETQLPELQIPQIEPSESEAPELQPLESEAPESQPAEIVETWTPERIEALTRLWEEGVTTAEIGRRIGERGHRQGPPHRPDAAGHHAEAAAAAQRVRLHRPGLHVADRPSGRG